MLLKNLQPFNLTLFRTDWDGWTSLILLQWKALSSMRLFAASIFAILLLFALAGRAPAAKIREVRLAEHGGFTRTVVELDSRASYRIRNHSSDKGFVTVELDHISSTPSSIKSTEKERLVTATKVEYRADQRQVQLHLRTKGAVRVDDFTLEGPNRIVIDFYEQVRRAAPEAGFRRQRIVLDPGHGGKDPGALGSIGGRRIQEKDIVLDVSRKLQRLLAADPRFEVVMTRQTDKYVALTERPRLASVYRGDMFISIHANAVGGSAAKRAKGFEIWTWNRSSNHSAAARAVAKLENREYGVTSENSTLLTTMMEDALESQALVSHRLATSVHKSYITDSYFRANDRGIDKARFKVLENYEMPSILIELGFMTHPSEVKLLNNSAFQQKMAERIYNGIVSYYRVTDPAFPSSQTARVAQLKK